MGIIFWLGSNVSKDERDCCGDNEDLKHEIVEGLKVDFAETFCLQRVAVVVSELLSPSRKVFAR